MLLLFSWNRIFSHKICTNEKYACVILSGQGDPIIRKNWIYYVFSTFFQNAIRQQNKRLAWWCVSRSHFVATVVSVKTRRKKNDTIHNSKTILLLLLLYFRVFILFFSRLLNANEISCIRKDAFRDLHSVNLLWVKTVDGFVY